MGTRPVNWVFFNLAKRVGAALGDHERPNRTKLAMLNLALRHDSRADPRGNRVAKPSERLA